jgi:diguanylate cyclase (GGDEF)-like protein
MNAKILVVDDDPVVLRATAEWLERAGYQVLTGKNGQEALARLRDDKPDLLLIDVEMPDLGGREICRIVRANANKSFGFLPVILMTARGDVQQKIQGLELGADDYLIKPLNDLELLARVKSMLRLKSLQDELLCANQRLQQVNEKLAELSMTDGLTGAFNRLYFQKRIGYEFQRMQRYRNPLALLMLDLDRFKRLNDTHGHLFGDFVLRHTAEIIRRSIRGVDIAARYGGEEFAVLCPETNLPQAQIVAERIRSNVERAQFRLEDVQASVTVSVGYAVCPHDTIGTPEALIERADQGLYRAKETGRNRVCSVLSNE